MFFTACKGQVKASLPGDTTMIANGAKLIKTLGTNQGANIHCGLQDNAGNLWFGTTGEGVYRFDGKSFVQFTVKEGLSNNTIYAMVEDGAGNIWFATDNGASRYDGKKFTTISIAEIQGIRSGLYPPASTSVTNAVWNILQDKTGKLWFGTAAGIFLYNGQSFSRFEQNKGIVNNNAESVGNVEYMVEDKTGKVWYGGRMTTGVFRFDGRTMTHFKPDGDHWYWPQLEDKSGNIWFSNWSGVCRFDGKRFVTYTVKDGLCNGNITCIIEDRNENIWFGSDDGGICRYDGTSFQKFGSPQGLDNYGVWCLVEDKEGNLWVGTRNVGLYRFDGKTFRKFSE